MIERLAYFPGFIALVAFLVEYRVLLFISGPLSKNSITMLANENFSLSFADGMAYCFYLQLFVLFPVLGLVVNSKIHRGHYTE